MNLYIDAILIKKERRELEKNSFGGYTLNIINFENSSDKKSE
jgi:hypothetical protein